VASIINSSDKLNQGRQKINAFMEEFNQTVIDGDSSVEAAQARVEADGTVNATLQARLNKKDTELNKNTLDIKGRGINVMFPPIPLMPPAADNIADDSEIFQAIINLGVKVIVPDGRYRIANTVILGSLDFVGSGQNTIFDIDGCDGFKLSVSTGRKITEIHSFRVLSSRVNCDNFCAFTSEQHLTNRALGYNIHHIEIGGEGRFGAGFLFYDMFRLDISHVGLTGAMNAVMLVGQIVQATLNAITSNLDVATSVTTTINGGKKCGLYVGGSSHNGVYQNPESVKTRACGFVGHDYGIYQDDCLFGVYDAMDLDYCKKIGAFINSASGGYILTDTWIAMDGAQVCYGIQIVTPNFDPHPIEVKDNHISFFSSVLPDSVGIFVSDASNAGRVNVKIKDNTIKAPANTIKHGILFNRTKQFQCSGNTVFPGCCTNEEIYMSWVEKFTCDKNIASRLYVYSDASYYECYGNHVDTYSLNGSSVKHFIKDGVIQA
jgi:hypothetical protein